MKKGWRGFTAGMICLASVVGIVLILLTSKNLGIVQLAGLIAIQIALAVATLLSMPVEEW